MMTKYIVCFFYHVTPFTWSLRDFLTKSNYYLYTLTMTYEYRYIIFKFTGL